MIRRYVYQGRPVHVLVCDWCGTAHVPPAPPLLASQARKVARADGWQASTSKKHKGRPDVCPACKATGEEGGGDVTARAVEPSSSRTLPG